MIPHRNSSAGWAIPVLVCLAFAVDPPTAQAGRYALSTFDRLQGVIAYDIHEDERGVIWIGSETGIWRWHANGFEQVSSPIATSAPTRVPDGWGRGAITLASDADGTLWIGTGGGLLGLDMKSLAPKSVPAPLQKGRINRLKREPNGEVWAAAETGLYRLVHVGGRVEARLVPVTKDIEIEDYIQIDQTLWIGTQSDVRAITPNETIHYFEGLITGRSIRLHRAADGAIWAGMRSKPGLYRIKDGAVRRFDQCDGLTNDEVNAIAERVNGEIWIGTERGAFRYTDGRFQEIGRSGGLVQDDVHAICLDRDDSIWLGTFGGGAVLLRTPDILTYGLADGLASQFISALYRESEDRIIVGSVQGVSEFDAGQGRGVTINHDSHVRAILKDADGRLWTGGRTYAFCLATGEKIDLPGVVRSLGMDHDGTLLVGTSKGLYRGQTSPPSRFELPENIGEDVWAILLDADGSLVVGADRGLAVRRGEAWQTVPTQHSIMSMARDSTGHLWVGTSRELLCLDRDTFEIRMRFGDLRHAQSIVALESGAIWCGCEDGLVIVEDGELHRFTLADGLPSNDVRALIALDEHTLLAGTTGGLARLNMRRLQYREHPPLVTIDVFTLGETLAHSGDSILAVPLQDQGLIAEVTTYGQRHIDGMRFQYRIRGHDEVWSEWTTDRRIRLPRLPAGRFVVEVRGRNAEGIVSQTADVSLEIVAPLWRRTGFLVTVGCGALIAMGSGAYLVRKRTDYRRRIEQSERQFRTLVESIQVIPYQADALSGTFRYVGPQSMKLLKQPVDRWSWNGSDDTVVPLEDIQIVRELWSKAHSSGEPCTAEHRLRHAGGETRWFRNIVGTLSKDDGGLLHGLMIDITAERLMASAEEVIREELREAVIARTAELTEVADSLRREVDVRIRIGTELRALEERFAQIFKLSPIAIVLSTEREGIILDANEAFQKMSGYVHEELIGRRCADLHMWTDSADREPLRSRMLEEGGIRSRLMTFQTKSGESRVARVSIDRIDLQGRSCLINVAEDVTVQSRIERELDRHREFLSTLIDVNPNFIFAKDRDGRFTLVNKAVADTFGIPKSEIIGKTDADFNLNKEEVAFFKKIDDEVIATRRERLVPEETITDSKGRLHYLQTVKLPLFDESGEPVGILGVATNITARKKAEDALRRAHDELEVRVQERTQSLAETQGFLQQILDYSPTLIFIKDDEGRTVFVNRAFSAELGIDSSEVVRRLFDAQQEPLSRPGDLRQETHSWAVIAQGSKTVKDERRIVMGGREWWFEVIRAPLPRPDGDRQVLCIATDITQRKAAEKRAIENEVFLQRMTDALPAAVYKFRRTADGRQSFDYISRGIEDIFETTAESILSDFSLAWSPILAEDVPKMESTIRESARTLKTWMMVFRIRMPSGKLKWLRGSSRPEPPGPDGDILWNGIVIDITEQKLVEAALRDSIERFELVADGAIDGLWDAVVGEDIPWHSPKTSVYFSPRFKELIGFGDSEFENSLGAWAERLHPDDQERVMRALTDHIERNVPYEIEYRLKTKSGEYRWFQARGKAVRNADGRVTRMAGSLNDITRRRQAEEALRQSQKLEAVGTLASGIAHQFDTLLCAISAYASLAKATLPKTHPAMRELEKVESTARDALNVTNSLLTFSHQAAPQRTIIDLPKVVHETSRMLARLLSARIQIKTEVPDAEPIWIHAATSQIEQIILNLALNAQDAMPHGGCLTIVLASVNRDGGNGQEAMSVSAPRRVRLTMSDTGAGIPSELLARIFEPFFTTKARGKGTGLGLSITQRLVDELGGSIQVESEPGRGTRFNIEFTCADPADMAHQPPSKQEIPASGDLALVIDRDPQVRSIMTSTVRAAGLNARPASSLDGALDFVRNRPNWLKVIVADLDTIGTDRFNDLSNLTEANPSLKIIVVVGTLNVNLKHLRLDGCMLLRKPFEMPELAELVEQCLDDSPT